MIVIQLVKKYPTSRNTKNHHPVHKILALDPILNNWIQFTPAHTICLRSLRMFM